MKIMINEEVVKNWINSRPGVNHRGSLRTDGTKLWSYELQIGDTSSTSGTKVVLDYTASGQHGFKSQTTSCHVGLASRYADLVG